MRAPVALRPNIAAGHLRADWGWSVPAAVKGLIFTCVVASAGPAHSATTCDADEAASRSPKSDVPIVIGYMNEEAYAQQWAWIDYDGHRKVYRTLKPGERVEQPTYVGHVWVATGSHGECEALFVAGQGG